MQKVEDKFSPEFWEDMPLLNSSATQEEIIVQINLITAHINKLSKLVIGIE